MNNPKKLTKKRNGKMFCGVCAGAADYLEVDVNVVRIIWAVVSFCTVGVGFVGYIAAALILPFED